MEEQLSSYTQCSIWWRTLLAIWINQPSVNLPSAYQIVELWKIIEHPTFWYLNKCNFKESTLETQWKHVFVKEDVLLLVKRDFIMKLERARNESKHLLFLFGSFYYLLEIKLLTHSLVFPSAICGCLKQTRTRTQESLYGT